METDRRIGAALAVMQMLYWSAVVKRELNVKVKLSIFPSIHIPALAYASRLGKD